RSVVQQHRLTSATPIERSASVTGKQPNIAPGELRDYGRLQARKLTSDRCQRAKRLGVAVLLLLLPVLPLQARSKSEAWASTQYANAQRLRENLNCLPSAQQSRKEYRRVIAAYRRVYYGSPASSKADPSVVAVAELLTEMGRHFNDDKVLHAAIGQYKFLRREYPGSHERFEALFTIGQIYQDDLKEPAQAKLTFEEFLHRYPHHHLAGEARRALSDPVQQAGLKSRDENDPDEDSNTPAGKEISSKGPKPAAETAQAEETAESRKPSYVTSIRHWSTPEYTRVAIGLEREVKFEAQRIENPERIFFDLLDTSLTSSLLGKTFDVDDALLKKIRVAQFQPGKSRIVLELADRSDYSTSVLTDPARLLIDIHSQDIRSKDIQGKTKRAAPDALVKEPVAPAETAKASTAATESKAEAKRPGNKPLPVAASDGARKTVVEADDDDDSAVTVAKLDPPEIKPAAKAPVTLPPPGLNLPALSRSSSRNRRQPTAIFPDVREASPTASGDRSLIRALGLKIGRIVIDPGHGGH